MKFFTGLAAGLAAGVVAQLMISKNHEQMLELIEKLPRPLKFGPEATLEELLAQKKRIEDLIHNKEQENAPFPQEEEIAEDSVEIAEEDMAAAEEVEEEVKEA